MSNKRSTTDKQEMCTDFHNKRSLSIQLLSTGPDLPLLKGVN